MNFLTIAVATKDGISVNQHFGHAREFYIYRVTDKDSVLLEKRDVALYCHGNSADQSAMKDILQTINDCDAVMIARVGDGPAEKLAAIGVTAIDDFAYLSIEEALHGCVSLVAERVAEKVAEADADIALKEDLLS